MTKQKNADISASERIQIFHETYGNDFDAGYTLVHLVKACGEYLTRIVGEDRANAGMSEITRDLSGGVDPGMWQEALEYDATNGFSEWPLGQTLHDLTAFAVFGVSLLKSESVDDRRAYLEVLIQSAEDFYQMSPISLWGGEHGEWSELGLLITLATNRWAMDHGKPVEPSAVAWFGHVKEASVRNMMSGQNRSFSNVDGRIPANEVIAWLTGRDQFWNSIWQDAAALGSFGDGVELLENPVFVPVSRDGSVFHPELDRAGGFTIGKKGEEQKIVGFNEALAELHKMPSPYWRRPNERGNFGIVQGVRWERLEMGFLWTIATNPNFRLPGVQ